MEEQSQTELMGECGDWAAEWNWSLAPGHISNLGPPFMWLHLLVGGLCRFPSDGYSVELKLRNPQGTDPSILLLERIVTQQTVTQQRPTEMPVSYIRVPHLGLGWYFGPELDQLSMVTILPDQVNITLPPMPPRPEIPWFLHRAGR
jgi:hypothetical protein